MKITKLGRPTIHKNGVPLTPAEKQHRYRVSQKRKRRAQSAEWYTPKPIVSAVRKVFGGTIDCDPASSAEAQTVVKAENYFTIDDNGLTKEWHGRVILNPPYSKHVIGKFVDKLLHEMKSGHVKQAVLIVHPKTSTKWFARATAQAKEICFTKRIPFWSPDVSKDKKGWSVYGQAILYFGNKPQIFRTAFKKFYHLQVSPNNNNK